MHGPECLLYGGMLRQRDPGQRSGTATGEATTRVRGGLVYRMGVADTGAAMPPVVVLILVGPVATGMAVRLPVRGRSMLCHAACAQGIENLRTAQIARAEVEGCTTDQGRRHVPTRYRGACEEIDAEKQQRQGPAGPMAQPLQDTGVFEAVEGAGLHGPAL